MSSFKSTILLFVLLFALSCEDGSNFQFDDINVSSSGSIAKFHIDQNYLYVVEDNALIIFDISDNTQANRLSKLILTNQVETIFKLDSVLYLGTTTGVLFYNISDPELPKLISTYEHLTSCDPVVANELYAFATLRSGRNCGIGNNMLEIINIADLTSPQLIASYPMTSPYGLGLLGNYLFVGEKDNGMRWFNISDVENVLELGYYPDIHAIDFIIKDNNITISTTKSLLQMKLTPLNELEVISELMYENN